eukprot:255064-Pyramimonas_sp.AAC.3
MPRASNLAGSCLNLRTFPHPCGPPAENNVLNEARVVQAQRFQKNCEARRAALKVLTLTGHTRALRTACRGRQSHIDRVAQAQMCPNVIRLRSRQITPP